MKYRPEIDGLRTIAILPVIFYHLSPNIVSFGYLGVDIFFVISGFLITKVIRSRIKKNHFSIINFYVRRIKRLMPIYFLIVLLSLPLAYSILFPHQLKDFSQSIIASLGFFSNWFFYFKIDYFNPFINFSPLIHTWSLSIEEQFYLFLPALLLLFNRSKKKLLIVIIFLTVLSYFYTIYLSNNNLSLSFYSSFSRFWELFIGVIAALVNFDFLLKKINKIVIDFISISALFFLVLTFFGIFNFVHPGPYTLYPVLLTLILIIFSEKSSILKNILSFRLFVHIGLLSYSLYLFHQPIISFYKLFKLNNAQHYSLNSFEYLSIVFFIYFVSYVSYKFYEKPIRYSNISQKNVFLSFFVCTIFLMSIGLYGHKTRGLNDSYYKKYADYIKYDIDELKNQVNNYSMTLNNSEMNQKDNDVLIIGDSFSRDLFIALNYVDQKKNFNYGKIQFDDKCFQTLIDNFKNENYEIRCDENNFLIKDFKNQISNSSIIMLSSLWENKTFRSGIDLAHIIEKNFHKKVFVVGPVQFFDILSISVDLNKNEILEQNFGQHIFDYHIQADIIKINNSMKKSLEETSDQIFFIDKLNFFCKYNSCNLFEKDGSPLIVDEAHLSMFGMKKFGNYVYEILESTNKMYLE